MDARRTWFFAALLALLALALPPAAAGAASPELIVRFEPGVRAAERADARRDADVSFDRALPLAGLEVVTASSRASEARLDRDPRVDYAEPNLRRTLLRTPDDPYFGSEWGLLNTGQTVLGTAGTPGADIAAPAAWDVTTGSAAVTVAVIDTGVDALHPDLAPNTWTNPGESGGGKESNGSDDDGDGLVDDVRGWDWVDGDAAPDDENGHGTHVAGTIAARGDDATGVAGVSWNAGVMTLRVLDASGSGSLADVISAYRYAAAHGAAVVNASFGGAGFSHAEYDAIRSAPGTLFVAAAGNDAANDDVTPEYPCAYDLQNVVCVAATDQRDALAGFSNFGATSVDLGAPGTRILSDHPAGGYAYMSGTSMATPHVSGVAALVEAHAPSASVAAVRDAILSGADPDPALTGRTVTGGRLDALGALDVIDGRRPSRGTTPPPAATPPPSVPAAPAPLRIALRVPHGKGLRWVARHGLRVRVRASAACTLTVKALGGRRAAGKRRLRLASTGWRYVRIRLHRVRKRLVVVAIADGGAAPPAAKRLRLSR